MERKNRRLCLLLLLACALALTACGSRTADDLPPPPEEGVLIYAALDPVSDIQKAGVDSFNQTHTDVQIEIRDYSDEGGPQRLLLELVLGRVPDIIELRQFGKTGELDPLDPLGWRIPIGSDPASDKYWMPYRQLVQKGYLENLWPYIENDPDLGREGVLEAPLKAAEVNGGLYMLFPEFLIMTLMGPERVVGDRYSWTFEDLMEAFSTMPADSTILRYNATKWDVFSELISFTLDKYVDWETGQCSFDSEEFRNILLFLNSFPTEFETPFSTVEMNHEIVWRIVHGQQMLESSYICSMIDICYKDAFWGERAAFVGYPTADGSAGSLFNIRGTVLAMSSTCQNKEAAWEYMRKLITKKHNRTSMDYAIKRTYLNTFVNQADYETENQVELMLTKRFDFKKDPEAMPPWKLFPDTSQYLIFPKAALTEEDIQRYETLINNTTQIYWPNNDLADIVWEASGPYFAGDRTMDETIQMIQNRVKLYVNEQR